MRQVMQSLGFNTSLGIVLALVVAVAFALSGCASQPERGPTLAEIRDSACPIALGVVLGLQVEPSVAPEVKARLHEVEPVIEAACAADSGLDALRAMSDTAFPVVLKLVAESQMAPEQKQAAVIAVTTARLLILNYRQYQVPAAAQ